VSVDLGGPLFVERLGSGPPMVLVHGLGSSHVHWLGVGPALARGRRVHIPDLPGFGYSPLAGRRADVESNAALLARFLDHLDEPAVVVGNSMGALLALLAARDRPQHTEALVLVSPPAPIAMGASFDPRLALLFSAYTWPVVGEVTRELWVRTRGPEGMVRSVLEACCSFADQVPPEVVHAARSLARSRPHQDEVHAFLAAYRSTWAYLLNRWRFDALLRAVDAPVLVIRGTADRLVPAAAAERHRRVRPDWTFASLPGVGHMPQLDDPVAFVALVSDWLAGVGGAGPGPGPR
jgi:pimeloyl-ACP methyl ester carboxylesterase